MYQCFKKIKKNYPKHQITFCNGGDRNSSNIPEKELSKIKFVFSIGGDEKQNASSDILKKWSHNKFDRRWGEFYELFSDKVLKVKELVIFPKKGMSFQRHFHRNEIWFVSEGSCLVNHSSTTEDKKKEYKLSKSDIFRVSMKEWHQIINPFDETCKIIEIQYGNKVSEEDIERLHYYDEN